MSTLFGIVIDHDRLESVKAIEKTVNSIMEMDYPPDQIKVIIHTMYVDYFQEIMHIINILKVKIKACEMLLHLVDTPTLQVEYDCFKKLVEADYFIRIKSGATLKKELFRTVTKILTEEPIKIFEADDTLIVSKDSVDNLYLKFYNYDDTVSHIKELSLKQGGYAKV